MLYVQLNQLSKENCLAGVQLARVRPLREPPQSMWVRHKEKTAEKIQRARNRVTREEIAENMSQLEDKCGETTNTYLISRTATRMIPWAIQMAFDTMPDEARQEVDEQT